MGENLSIYMQTCLPPTPHKVYIEGIHVDALIDDIHVRVQARSKEKGVRIRYEVIAWNPITVAADKLALLELIDELIGQAIDLSPEGTNVTLRAFPSHDDICTTFEITDCRTCVRDDDDQHELERQVIDARAKVERMGGELAVLPRSQGGMRVLFWLPQWITSELGCESIRRHAA